MLIEGVLGVQKEAVLASKRSVVTVEEIVEDFGPRSLNAVILPHWTVGHVVEVPGGAFPSYAQGYYARDNSFYKKWDDIARERDTCLAWMKENVLAKGPAGVAGLKVGDVVTKIDGRSVTNVADVLKRAGRLAPGGSVKLTIQRAGKTSEIAITTGEGI